MANWNLISNWSASQRGLSRVFYKLEVFLEHIFLYVISGIQTRNLCGKIYKYHQGNSVKLIKMELKYIQ